MKRFKLLLLVLIVTLLFTLSSCSVGSGIERTDDGYLVGPVSDGTLAPGGDFGYRSSVPSLFPSLDGKMSEGGYDNSIRYGQMTGKAWSDCENYQKWLELVTSGDNNEKHYLATQYDTFVNQANLLKSKNMLQVVIKSGEEKIENAKVIAKLDNGYTFTAMTNANGIAYLFFEDSGIFNIKFKIEYNGTSFEKDLVEIPENRLFEINLDDITLKSKIKTLDLCLVVDTTGSMADELEYLKVELRNVLEQIAADIDYDINLALIFYRDDGDEYITKEFGFTSNLAEQYANLGQQSADGGGDFPESVEVALEKANSLQWRSDSVKILIQVLDAPLHENTTRYISFGKTVNSLASKGVRVIPVICSSSGGDSLLEFTMRSAALMTGGTYTWLTDDSGIGGVHVEPDVDDDVPVEYFNKMLIRLIKEYCTGEKIDPESYNGQGNTNQDPNESDKYSVTFYLTDTEEYTTILVNKDSVVVEPKNPEKEGYTFNYWFIKNDDGIAVEFDFATPITSNIKLYASWSKNTPI